MNHFDRRRAVVSVAEAELGVGRAPAYWRDVLGQEWRGPYPQHWCGAFALWCLHQVGLALSVRWLVGKGFCEVQRLPKTTTPLPGDVAYLDKPFQHHAVVKAVEGEFVVTIDGNQGGPTPVQEKRRKRSAITCVYSIAPFLSAAELEPADSRAPTDPAPAPSPEVFPTLRRGDRGAGVGELQRRLNAKLGALEPSLVVDGDFGAKTEVAVREVQGLYALKVDGVAGPKTWAALT
jgi:hypothetical protein